MSCEEPAGSGSPGQGCLDEALSRQEIVAVQPEQSDFNHLVNNKLPSPYGTPLHAMAGQAALPEVRQCEVRLPPQEQQYMRCQAHCSAVLLSSHAACAQNLPLLSLQQLSCALHASCATIAATKGCCDCRDAEPVECCPRSLLLSCCTARGSPLLPRAAAILAPAARLHCRSPYACVIRRATMSHRPPPGDPWQPGASVAGAVPV